MNAKSTRLRFPIFLFLLALVLILSRQTALTHNLQLHPDEHVFYEASDSMARFLLGRAESYEELKEYPEGNFVFQLPFQLIAQLTLDEPDIHIVARLSSLFYFAIAAVLGCVVLKRYFPKRRGTVPVYALCMLFSLMHIEQSRYATGEASTFLTLMLVIITTAEALRGGKHRTLLLVLSFFLCGVAAAIKYPQGYFFLLPLYALVVRCKGTEKKRRFPLWLISFFALFAGLMLFSPKAILDPLYFYRACRREVGEYLVRGTLCEVGGALNHLVSILIYALFYADLPLSPVLFVLSVVKLGKTVRKDEPTEVFFARIVPAVTFVFLLYNAFVKTLYMRTVYPWFCISLLYACDGAGMLLERRGVKRVAVLALTALMVLRGGYFIYALSERDAAERYAELVYSAPDENWSRTTLLMAGAQLPLETDGLVNYIPEDIAWDAKTYATTLDPDTSRYLEPGELLISQSQSHGWCQHYLFPVRDPRIIYIINRWDNFVAKNKDCFVGQVYPEHYYYLFGYWVRGTTGTDYEFPSNMVFYKSA